MYRIGEFSVINRLTVKTLRHYDELGLLKPAHVDPYTGYRFYTGDQLPVVRKIIGLKTIGFSLYEIADLLKNDTTRDEWLMRLELKRTEVRASAEAEREKLTRLNTYISHLKKEHRMRYDVTIKNLPEVTVASWRQVIDGYGDFFTICPHMGDLMRGQHLECATPAYCFTLYHDGEFKEHDIDVEVCEAIVTPGHDEERMTFKTVPAVPTAACLIHQGPYTTIGESYAALTKWIEDNGYEVTDLMRESYIDGIWNQDDESKWITEIQAPVRKKN